MDHIIKPETRIQLEQMSADDKAQEVIEVIGSGRIPSPYNHTIRIIDPRGRYIYGYPDRVGNKKKLDVV